MTPLLIEGYAALFGAADLAGDVVRAGAFTRSLARSPPHRDIHMLLQHRSGALAGHWTRIAEDGRGLYVRGLITSESGRALIDTGVDGLSIGFRPRLWKPRAGQGRDLIEIDLVEVSLVAEPMQPRARFTLMGCEQKRAA